MGVFFIFEFETCGFTGLLHFSLCACTIVLMVFFYHPQDMDSIVETMMQQLLSKEILHEPMKDIVEKYPKWLEDNRDKISKEEYDRYNNQLDLMVKLIQVYENDPENMTKIFDIMQNMQECGQPPSDLVQDIIPDMDLSKLGQL